MALEVLVVGAGPTGLMAAVELARLGHRPTVIEKRGGPSTLSRAVGIHAGSIELMRACGAADAILAEAIVFSGLRLHDGARLVGTLPLNFDARSRLYGLPQDRTEAHLADALARYGVRVQYGAPLEGFSDDGAHITADFAGTRRTFDYVVGADGKNSTVRTAIGVPYDGFDLPGSWSIADVDCADWPSPTAFCGYLLPHGQVVVVVPLEAERFRVVASTPDALAALPVPMNVTRVRRAGTFAIAVRQVPRYGVGRVVLAGDAAHCHSPAGGRGMNLGIADAAELAARMASGTLDGYSASRHAAGRHVIAFSERARKGAQSRHALRRRSGVALLRAASAFPPLGRRLARAFVSG